ncbi:hypothetical protein Tco_0457726 [Tanacetum coccineum]
MAWENVGNGHGNTSVRQRIYGLECHPPHRQDQLVKVSSSAFICVVMGNLLPSLGTMKNTELFVNVVALAILVITAVANICIQMSTRVIFVFWIEHAFIELLMLILLAIACSLSLAIPTTKYYLDIQYSEKLKLTNIECSRKKHLSVAEGLREDLKKYWILAYSSGPQLVIGRSAPCTASGAFMRFSARRISYRSNNAQFLREHLCKEKKRYGSHS